MQSFLDDGPIHLIARLTRTERLNNENLIRKGANRAAFEFDAIDARVRGEEASAIVKGEGDRSRLVVIKVLTTAANFCRLSKHDFPTEGDWFSLELEPRSSQPGPYAWASALGPAGYLGNTRLVVAGINWLFSERDLPLRPLSAGIPASVQLARQIASACSFPVVSIGKNASARHVLASIPRPHDILVHDVGQASFASLRDKNKQELLHLDAGWPISYNLHTAGSVPRIDGKAAPVILSHWDWDHLHGFHVMPCLRQSIWISPVQRLGPGASLVANALAMKDCLYGVSINTLAAGPVIIGRCRGKRGNSNNTGLWARVTFESGKSLLYTGDGEYDLVPLQHRVQPDFLVVTHHGAEFAGAIPAPTQAQNICIVSVGAKNTYGHPSSAAVGRHKAAGWHPSFTCRWGRRARGSRIVGP